MARTDIGLELMRVGLVSADAKKQNGTSKNSLDRLKAGWTDERTEKLKKMWIEGSAAIEIAKELGEGATRNSVIGKAKRLGLHKQSRQRKQIQSLMKAGGAHFIEHDGVYPIGRRKQKPQKKKKKSSVKKPYKIRTDGQKIIQAIPNADISDIMGIWMNTIRILSDPKTKGQEKDLARKIQFAINNNWVKRYGGKIDETGYFVWPSTHALASNKKMTTANFEDWQQEGVLSFYGYHVGNTNGISSSKRKTILKGVFYAVIPPIFEFSYLYQWGVPETPERLKKMADVLASNARNFKRQQKSVYFDAIAEWEDDLHFLKNQFYIGKFNFDWPNAGI